MRGRRRILALGGLLVVVAASLYLVVVEAPRLRVRQAIHAALRPVALSNCTFRRFGHPHDGGYVMCGNLLDGAEVGYAYGIDGRDDWGCEISRTRAIAVHQYDCFNTSRPACEGGRFVFHPECIGPRAEAREGRPFDSLEAQLGANGDGGRRLVVKMDVEGAEWDSLGATPDEVLARIDQLSIELHGSSSEPRFLAVLEKLRRHFFVVNVHVNNYSCDPRTWPIPGRAYEVLFVSKRLGKVDEAAIAPPGPNPLDAPNQPERADCQFTWRGR